MAGTFCTGFGSLVNEAVERLEPLERTLRFVLRKMPTSIKCLDLNESVGDGLDKSF